ncbi:hypothetical protein FJTKL_04533 [Diaporthe vaccinii]|uniref:Uncharacterized protein n=1 Tax=Diaporthe vaccinii TaxID=105482 RepID=A0ABR4DSV7_9PEZI
MSRGQGFWTSVRRLWFPRHGVVVRACSAGGQGSTGHVSFPACTCAGTSVHALSMGTAKLPRWGGLHWTVRVATALCTIATLEGGPRIRVGLHPQSPSSGSRSILTLSLGRTFPPARSVVIRLKLSKGLPRPRTRRFVQTLFCSRPATATFAQTCGAKTHIHHSSVPRSAATRTSQLASQPFFPERLTASALGYFTYTTRPPTACRSTDSPWFKQRSSAGFVKNLICGPSCYPLLALDSAEVLNIIHH